LEPEGGLSQEQAGTLAHALMSRLDDAASYDSLKDYLAAELRFLGHDAEAQGMRPLTDDLMASLASPLGQKLLQAPPESRRFEMDFIWRGQILGRPVHLRGQVDAMLSGPDGYTLMDFKYGWPSRHNRRYVQQLQLYAWALRALDGEGPTEGQLFYLKAPQSPRPVPVDAAACAWVPRALELWAEQHGVFAAKAWPA